MIRKEKQKDWGTIMTFKLKFNFPNNDIQLWNDTLYYGAFNFITVTSLCIALCDEFDLNL